MNKPLNTAQIQRIVKAMKNPPRATRVDRGQRILIEGYLRSLASQKRG